jgi:hypothetical protein
VTDPAKKADKNGEAQQLAVVNLFEESKRSPSLRTD